MLVLTREKGQEIIIGGGLIRIAVVDIQNGKVRIGIEAPTDIKIDRKEVYERKELERDSNKSKETEK